MTAIGLSVAACLCHIARYKCKPSVAKWIPNWVSSYAFLSEGALADRIKVRRRIGLCCAAKLLRHCRRYWRSHRFVLAEEESEELGKLGFRFGCWMHRR